MENIENVHAVDLGQAMQHIVGVDLGPLGARLIGFLNSLLDFNLLQQSLTLAVGRLHAVLGANRCLGRVQILQVLLNETSLLSFQCCHIVHRPGIGGLSFTPDACPGDHASRTCGQ
jgi:hypothetical protein